MWRKSTKNKSNEKLFRQLQVKVQVFLWEAVWEHDVQTHHLLMKESNPGSINERDTRVRGAHGFARLPTLHLFSLIKNCRVKEDAARRRTSSSAVGCYGIEGVRACVRASNKQTKPLYSANFTMQTLKIKTNSWFFWVAKVWNMYHVFLIIKFAKKNPNKQNDRSRRRC